MAQKHHSHDHLWSLRLLVFQPERHAQGRNSRRFQAFCDLQLWQHQSRKLACRYHSVSASIVLGCSAECGWRWQPSRFNLVLRTGMSHRHLGMGCRVHQQICLQLHCALRKELRRCCQGHVEVCCIRVTSLRRKLTLAG